MEPIPFSAPARAAGCAACCGPAAHQVAGLPEDMRRRVEEHPCYSERAHHHFARMHLAVAPACNIQCHYCNRKFDCANESRPGVVSELLKPEQAARKALAVAAAIPQMSVVGIAGPGDPLANPTRTFATFRAIAAKAPDLKLCLSTNGLALPDHVDELARLGVDHVTVTINCIDPDVGAQIYPWILWNRKRVFGREAAEILVGRQLAGLEMLAARGILAKVNSVMIPGVNDRHLVEVSRAVKARGAFLHNVVPLIADPSHGTHYGLSGRRGPTPAELAALQDACEGDMRMMRHCRQCRADAVGMLGEDRGAEFAMERIAAMEIDHEAAMARRAAFRAGVAAERETPPAPMPEKVVALHRATRAAPGRPMLVAVATRGQGLVNEHFGHAREFLVYEATAAGGRLVGVRKAELHCAGQETCGDDEDRLARNLRALAGCAAVLCARIGLEPWRELEAAGIRPDSAHAMEPIEAAVMALWHEMRATAPTAEHREAATA